MFPLVAQTVAFGGPTGSAELVVKVAPEAVNGADDVAEAGAEVGCSSDFALFGGRPTRGREDWSPFPAFWRAACSLLRR